MATKEAGYKFDDATIHAVPKDAPTLSMKAKIGHAKRELRYAKRALAKVERQNKQLEKLRKQASETWDAILVARDDQNTRY